MSNYLENNTYSDPAVPMIQLPMKFKTQRTNTFADRNTGLKSYYDILDVEGCGAVRHVSILYGEGRRLEITVDGAETPQVDMPLKPFFGIMHNLTAYEVDSPAYTVTPNFGTPVVPGNPGYNLYLPIPFSKSCRIRLYLEEANGDRGVYTMVDWHQYEANSDITPFRLGAQHRLYTPAPPRNWTYEMADVSGAGFVAGVVLGVKQRDESDMIYHTSGMSVLIDGETNPHVIRGDNMEDDFGFTWGFHAHQAKWIGIPYHKWGGPKDQDGVVYRFFGPDPIAFDSSISFRSGSRLDDIETVTYYYHILGSQAPPIATPESWLFAGLYEKADDWEAFNAPEAVEGVVMESWEEHFAKEAHFIRSAPANRGWLDFRFSGANPEYNWDYFVNRSTYAGGVWLSDSDKEVTLRIAFDDCLILWVNGEKIEALRHDDGFRIAHIPARLRKGKNEFLLKTNNLGHCFNQWVVNFVIEE